MRISDWSSDVCSSDLVWLFLLLVHRRQAQVLEVEAEVRARRDRHHPRLDDLPVRIERKGQERIRVQATVAPAHDEGVVLPVLQVAEQLRGLRELDLPALAIPADGAVARRSATRRLGNECCSTCRFRWSP